MNPILNVLRSLAGKVIVPRFQAHLRRFEAQMQNAQTVQRKLLFAKLRRCADSQFGRDHHFRSIKTLEDFRRQIPIAQYDYYYPYVKKVTEGDVGAMFPANDKIMMFTLSSGTTDAPKLIPVNKVWFDEYRRGWAIWGVKAFLDHPALFYSKLAGIAGNWDMRRTPTNLPCGMASGLSARLQTLFVRMVYCVPAIAFEINDVAAKYYTALRLSIAHKVGLFMTATPATVVNFAKLGDQYRQELIRDIHDGTFDARFELEPRIRKQLGSKLTFKDPQRAKELEQIVNTTGHLYPKDYWQMSLVACWLGGTVGSYAQHIAEYYGPTPTRDIGLLCSEGRFTLPLEDGTPAGALEISSHYYEFIPEDEIDAPQPTVLEAHELTVGKNYYILLTTSCGLYRYNIHDLMRCTGYVGQTPLLEFLNKGQRFSDMEGEKISEFHLVKAVSEVAKAQGVKVTSFTAVPIRPAPEQNQPPYYRLLMEEQDLTNPQAAIRFLTGVDRWLAENNVMYQGKRADGYLGPLRLQTIPAGSMLKYDREEIARRRAGEDHYKHPCLVLDEQFTTRFPTLAEIAPPQASLP